MKEPTLEENKLELKVLNNSILIEKSFLLKPQSEKLNITIFDPDGKKHKRKLIKSKNKYTATFRYIKNGFYLVYDGDIEKGIFTVNQEKKELQDFHLTEKIISETEISNVFSKAVWISDYKLPAFKESVKVNSNYINDKAFYLLRNKNSYIEEIENKQILNPIIVFLLVMLLFYFCWKEESK